MDPVTHGLIGAALGRLAPEQAYPAVFWGTVLAAMAPDVDVVVRWVQGRHAYLKHHRGASHSPGALLLWSAVVTGLMLAIWPEARARVIFLWALLGTLSHVAFDLLNAYGTQALWPWNRRRLAYDILQIIELPLVALLTLGLWAAAAWPEWKRTVLGVAWGLIILYILLRVWAHARCVGAVRGRFAALAPARVSVVPYLFGVNRWRYVIEIRDHFYSGEVTAWPPAVLDSERAEHGTGAAVDASRAAPAVEALLVIARHPRATCRRHGHFYVVHWEDLRYRWKGRPVFYAIAVLDDRLNLVDDRVAAQVRGELGHTAD